MNMVKWQANRQSNGKLRIPYVTLKLTCKKHIYYSTLDSDYQPVINVLDYTPRRIIGKNGPEKSFMVSYVPRNGFSVNDFACALIFRNETSILTGFADKKCTEIILIFFLILSYSGGFKRRFTFIR